MKKTIPLIALFTLIGLDAAEPDYAAWTAALKAHVKPGVNQGISAHMVDYKAIGKDANFARAVKTMEEFDITRLQTAGERMAFYINAYNIAAVRKVLAMYPTQSITAKGDGVWKAAVITLAGRAWSLDAMENQILRPMGDPRIHFAIVCASLSCPDLRREAYSAAKLATQLEDQARAFLRNETKGLRLTAGRIGQSQIFEWFAGDFKDVGAFQKKYRPGLPDGAARYAIPYNWSLNGQ
jgi:hypothetical protein